MVTFFIYPAFFISIGLWLRRTLVLSVLIELCEMDAGVETSYEVQECDARNGWQSIYAGLIRLPILKIYEGIN